MFAVGYRSVEDILAQPYYFVDKSLFIPRLIDDPARIRVILRPREMGKSVNMSMLSAFFNCMQEASAGFRRLPVLMRDPERVWEGYVKGHAGKYAVIRIDWLESGVLEASDEVEMEMRMLQYVRRMLRGTIESMGMHAEQLERVLPENLDLEEIFRAESLNLATKALGALAHILGTGTENQVLILIDDYDAIYRKAAEVNAYTSISEFLVALFAQLGRMAGSVVWKVVAFGTHKLKGGGYLGGLQLEDSQIGLRPGLRKPAAPIEYSYLGAKEDRYKGDFGFTEAEVTAALEELKCGLNIGEMEEWYQVISESTTTVLLHPHSTASAIKYGRVQSYWTQDCPIRFHQYPFTKMLEMEGFGPGTLEQIALQPHSHEFTWPTEYHEVDYDPEAAAQLITRDVLAWLHAEGYSARAQAASHEAGAYLVQMADQWFDQQTGFIQALHAFTAADEDFTQLDLTDLRNAMDRILKMKCFHLGRSPLNSNPVFPRFIRRLLSSMFPSKEPWMLDGEMLPVMEVQPGTFVVVSFDLSGRQPAPGYYASRLKMSKVIHAGNTSCSFWVLCCHLDGQGRPATSLTLAHQATD